MAKTNNQSLGLKENKPSKNRPKQDFFAEDTHDAEDVGIPTVVEDADEEDGLRDADVLTDEADLGVDPIQRRIATAPNEDTVKGYRVTELDDEGNIQVVSRAIPHVIDDTVEEKTSPFNPGFVIRKRIKPVEDNESVFGRSSILAGNDDDDEDDFDNRTNSKKNFGLDEDEDDE